MTPDPGKGEWSALAVTGAGVGTAAWLAAELKKLFPSITVEDTWVKLLAGLGMYYYGDRYHWAISSYGAGVMLDGIGSFIKTYVPLTPQYAQAAHAAPVQQVFPQLSPEQMLHNLAAAAAQQGTQVYGTAKYRSTFIPEVLGQ